jgi:hypothetical protein
MSKAVRKKFDYKRQVTLQPGWDRAVGIVTGYGLDDGEVGVRDPVGQRIFSSPHCPETGSGTYPAKTKSVNKKTNYISISCRIALLV